MHSKHIDLARTAACWQEEPSPNLNRGVLYGLIVVVPVNALIAMIAALAWRWL